VAFFFGGGTLAPERRASLSAIAIACFGFFTLALPPDFSSPCLYSCITWPILALAFGDVLLLVVFFAADFFVADELEEDFFVGTRHLPKKLGQARDLPPFNYPFFAAFFMAFFAGALVAAFFGAAFFAAAFFGAAFFTAFFVAIVVILPFSHYETK